MIILAAVAIQSPKFWDERSNGTVAVARLRNVPTRKGVRLVVCIEGSGFPLQYSLYVDEGKTTVRAKHIGDLAGKMNIRSEKDALRFVRIYTSFTTGCYDGKAATAEIVPGPKLKETTWFGQPEFHDWSRFHWDGYVGMVFSKPALDAIKGYPKTERDSSGYIVTRPIFRVGWDYPCEQLFIREHVDPDGTYKVISETPIKSGPLADIELFYPTRK